MPRDSKKRKRKSDKIAPATNTSKPKLEPDTGLATGDNSYLLKISDELLLQVLGYVCVDSTCI